MFVQKQKKILQNVSAKLGSKLVLRHVLRLEVPIMLSVSVLVLALYAQPVPSPTQIHSQQTAHQKTITHHAPTPPKVIQPAAAAPKVAAAPPSNPLPAPVKATQALAGTPKPEPVVTPSPSSSVSGLTPTTPAPASSQPPSSQIAVGYTSTNWSGYLATNGSFTGVSGSWTATNATGNGSTTSADSTWIGIGGVTTGDLIQVGTQNIIAANGQVSTSAFYELLPNFSQPVPGVTVSPNDSLTASLSEISGGQWTISITDETNGESYTATVAYASSLSSAEWIEEDPSFFLGRQIPFDNFQKASFGGGSTVDNNITVTIAMSTAQPVTMVDRTGQTIAVPSAIGSDGASFIVTP